MYNLPKISLIIQNFEGERYYIRPTTHVPLLVRNGYSILGMAELYHPSFFADELLNTPEKYYIPTRSSTILGYKVIERRRDEIPDYAPYLGVMSFVDIRFGNFVEDVCRYKASYIC